MQFRIAIMALFFSIASQAAERQWHIGWMAGVVSPQVQDPAGPTQNTSVFQWKDVVVLYDYSRDYRLFGMLKKYDYTLDASPNEIGQDVSHTGFVAGVQRDLRLSRTFKPWVGAGVEYVSEKYEPRYTITPTGFLARQFPNRSESGVAAVVNASAQWDSFADTKAGLHFQYEYGLSGLSRAVSVSLFLSY